MKIKHSRTRLSLTMKSVLLAASLSFISGFSQAKDYNDATLPVEERVELLLKEMTLEEKIAQMDMLALWNKDQVIKDKFCEKEGIGAWIGELPNPEVGNELQKLAEKSRLKIPVLIGVDAAHGYGLIQSRTIFPTSISIAGSFDPELVEKTYAICAKEVRSVGNHWTFAPSVDITQDARWGRTGEAYGEDPYLSSVLVTAAVNGLQGDLDPKKNIAACVKHLACGGVSVGGVNHGSADVSERKLRTDFLPPFKAAIKAGVMTIMPGHNDIDGIPAHANKMLLTDIVKDEMGFDGFYITDMGDIENLIPNNGLGGFHHVANDQKDAVRQGIAAGLDMNMYTRSIDGKMPYAYFQGNLKELLKEGKITQERIDDAVRRILRVKFKLGLFENRYIDVDKANTDFCRPEDKALALEAARKSIVLLKNTDKLLPIDTAKYKKILVTGPNANNQNLLGDWTFFQPDDHITTVLEGMEMVGKDKVEIVFSDSGRIKGKKSNEKVSTTDPSIQEKEIKEGGEINDFSIQDAVDKAKDCDLIVVAIGGQGIRSDWGIRTYGESCDRPSIDFYGRQVELVQKLQATGKPVVAVLIHGKPLNNPWVSENIPAIVDAWEPGMAGGQAIAEILFGDVNPSGKLPITIPQTAGHVPQFYYQPLSRTATGYSIGSSRADDKPAFCFGHGLSYTTYDYKDFKVKNTNIKKGEDITITGTITNTGDRAGEETVLAFFRDDVSSIVTPLKRLRAFDKIAINPGESKKVELTIPFEELGLWNIDMKYVVEPGTFTIMVGSSVDKIHHTEKVEYKD